MKFDLNDKVRDVVTGFSGLVVARCEYLHGGKTYEVQPCGLKPDGGIAESTWFDEGRLESVSE